MVYKSFLSIRWVFAATAILLLAYQVPAHRVSNKQDIRFLPLDPLVVASNPDDDKNDNFDFNFTILDLKGNKVPMDQFKGKVIFLNQWATWCGPCRAEMPSIQKLYNSVDKDNVMFIMLSRDQAEDTPKITKYISSKGFNFPVYQAIGQLPKQLETGSIPTTFLISKQGKIVKGEVGIINPAEFKSLIDAEVKK